MKGISHASSVAEVKAALEALHVRHETTTAQLESSIAQHDELSRHLRRLDLSRARLSSLAVTTRSISHGMLSGAASTAKHISEAVERLDTEQARVKATLDVVEQVAELKACVLGVTGSMGAPQDWETAAEYIYRASQIPMDVITSGFAEAVVPTAEVPDPPSVTLDSAAQSLCQLFLREFEKAVEEADGAKITRFFKMFPLIGRSKEGLEAYGRYVCQGVAVRARTRLQTVPGTARKDGFLYANALTKLFEHIAQVIDGHSALVERHYGAGTMVKVMERLHNEADVQGGIILDTWNDERTIDRKLTDVKSYAFSFLVQSFLPTQRNASGTPRAQSPAVGGTVNGAQDHMDEGLEMKDVDQVLNEIGAMLGRWSLYVRFIASRAAINEVPEASDAISQPLGVPNFIIESSLPKKVSKILLDPFKAFATFFLRRSVEKAFQLDESPSGLWLSMSKPLEANPPFITSAVDDVMYVVNQILQRALATSQAEIVIATASTVGRVLGSDFIGMVQRKMRDESYPKAVMQGALPPEDKVVSFLVLTNNLDVATDYIKRIVRTHADVDSSQQHEVDRVRGRELADLFPMGRDANMVRNALRSLESGFVTKATELNGDGIAVVFQQVLKPRMRSILADAFREAEYTSSGDAADGHGFENGIDEGSEALEPSTVRARLQSGWEALTKPMKRILSERNFERLLSTITSYLSNILEKRIWSYHGRISELGAVALEKDIVDIVNVTVKGENFKLRESFNRCLQIVTIMNLEDDEWDALKATPGGDTSSDEGWVLDEDECYRARTVVKERV